MGYLITIFIAIALLVGFFVLTRYEAWRGVRFFASTRAHLDRGVKHIEFVLTNVDLVAFLRAEIHHGISHTGHAIAHLSLQVVRAIERLLTRLVRHLRTRHQIDTIPHENVREFVKTLSDFKGGLKATHPEISDVQ